VTLNISRQFVFLHNLFCEGMHVSATCCIISNRTQFFNALNLLIYIFWAFGWTTLSLRRINFVANPSPGIKWRATTTTFHTKKYDRGASRRSWANNLSLVLVAFCKLCRKANPLAKPYKLFPI